MHTEQERYDIVCALEIAADQYRKDAETNAVLPRTARHFRELADRAEQLINKLINAARA